MTLRVRVGILKVRPAAVIFAILCAVIVSVGSPTEALAVRNYIVQLLGYTGEPQCGQIFAQAAARGLTTVQRCGYVDASCQRHVRNAGTMNIATARDTMEDAIAAGAGADDVEATVTVGANC